MVNCTECDFSYLRYIWSHSAKRTFRKNIVLYDGSGINQSGAKTLIITYLKPSPRVRSDIEKVVGELVKQHKELNIFFEKTGSESEQLVKDSVGSLIAVGQSQTICNIFLIQGDVGKDITCCPSIFSKRQIERIGQNLRKFFRIEKNTVSDEGSMTMDIDSENPELVADDETQQLSTTNVDQTDAILNPKSYFFEILLATWFEIEYKGHNEGCLPPFICFYGEKYLMSLLYNHAFSAFCFDEFCTNEQMLVTSKGQIERTQLYYKALVNKLYGLEQIVVKVKDRAIKFFSDDEKNARQLCLKRLDDIDRFNKFQIDVYDGLKKIYETSSNGIQTIRTETKQQIEVMLIFLKTYKIYLGTDRRNGQHIDNVNNSPGHAVHTDSCHFYNVYVHAALLFFDKLVLLKKHLILEDEQYSAIEGIFFSIVYIKINTNMLYDSQRSLLEDTLDKFIKTLENEKDKFKTCKKMPCSVFESLTTYPELYGRILIEKLMNYLNVGISAKDENSSVKFVLTIERVLEVIGEQCKEMDINFKTVQLFFPLAFQDNLARYLYRIRGMLMHPKEYSLSLREKVENDIELYKEIQKELIQFRNFLLPLKSAGDFEVNKYCNSFGRGRVIDLMPEINNIETDPIEMKRCCYFFKNLFDYCEKKLPSIKTTDELDSISNCIWSIEYLLKYVVSRKPFENYKDRLETLIEKRSSLIEEGQTQIEDAQDIDSYIAELYNIQITPSTSSFTESLRHIIGEFKKISNKIRESIDCEQEDIDQNSIEKLKNSVSFIIGENEKIDIIKKLEKLLPSTSFHIVNKDINKEMDHWDLNVLLKSAKCPVNVKEGLDNIRMPYKKAENRLRFLRKRISRMKDVLNQSDTDIDRLWKSSYKEEKINLLKKIIQSFLHDLEVQASIEVLLLDCFDLLEDEKLKKLMTHASIMYKGLNLRNLLAHGNLVLETIGNYLEPNGLLWELGQRIIGFVEDLGLIDDMLTLYSVPNTNSYNFSTLLKSDSQDSDYPLRLRIRKYDNWPSYAILIPRVNEIKLNKNLSELNQARDNPSP